MVLPAAAQILDSVLRDFFREGYWPPMNGIKVMYWNHTN